MGKTIKVGISIFLLSQELELRLLQEKDFTVGLFGSLISDKSCSVGRAGLSWLYFVPRHGPWKRESTRKEWMSQTLQSGKPSSDVHLTRAGSLI